MSERLPELRVLIDGAGTGTWNMAVDQAILELVNQTLLPTLRFYSWQPATLSLGYFQTLQSRNEHPSSIQSAIVRRASGGGAIMHHHEITYSIIIPSKQRWSDQNNQLYRLAHDAITDLFLNQAIKLISFSETEPLPAGPKKPFLCFQRRYPGDLLCDGHKVVGSAQRRAKNALLQHGSILLSRSKFAPELPGIFDLSDKTIEESDIVTGLTDLFSERMGASPKIGALNRDEIALAQRIQVERFQSALWTNKQKRLS